MTPFEIACPSCSKKLKVTRPELIGKKIGCPGCKAPIQIDEPSANGSAPKADGDPGAVLAAAASSSGPSYSAGIRKSKQGGFKPKHITTLSACVFGFVVLAFGADYLVKARRQDEIRDSLTPAQKRALAEKERVHGKGNVRLEVSNPKPRKKDTPAVPVKSKVREDFQDFEFARGLHGKIQQLIRSHNRNPVFQQLRGEYNQLEQQYRYSKIEPPEFEALCGELLTKVNRIEHEEVNKRLAVILELNSIDGPPAETLMAKFHDTVLPLTFRDWRIDSAARKKVELAVLSTLDGTGLESNAAFVARLVKFAEECY